MMDHPTDTPQEKPVIDADADDVNANWIRLLAQHRENRKRSRPFDPLAVLKILKERIHHGRQPQ